MTHGLVVPCFRGATFIDDIFISYRRDDSAGHAGRLFDGLKERWGAEHVFMDVAGLRPGQDFAIELEQAVGRADCLLAVIGPRWMQAVDASGQRRIDDPDDLVRREIVSGLAKCATVIPVLVHGATMPRASQLPEPLQPLVRRQAIALSDPRWDSDLRELVQFLLADGRGKTVPRAREATATTPSKAWRYGAGVVVLFGLALAAAGAWWAFHAPNQPVVKNGVEAAAAGVAIDPPTKAVARTPPPVEASVQRQPFAITLPPLTDVRFRTNRAQVEFSILGIRQEPRDTSTQVLSFLVRMFNRGPADEAFGSDQFRLIAGEQSIAPAASLISSTEASEAKETTLRFVVPSGIVDVALEVRLYADSTRIPVALSARSPIPGDASLDEFGRHKPARVVDTLKRFPAPMAVHRAVQVGSVAFDISSAVIERETAEKASLAVTVRCSAPPRSGGVSFGSGTVRLWIDGVPRAPVNAVNLAVDSGDSKEAVFVFDLVWMPQTLEVGLRHNGDSVRVPLPLASLAGR
ncbi:MAG: toll/interleukin-1 receptor domain-containing protein [Rubrivivax sp.]